MAFQADIRSFYWTAATKGKVDDTADTSVAGICRKRPRLGASVEAPARPVHEEIKHEAQLDLGAGSEIVYYPRFLNLVKADEWLKVLDRDLPWSRPTLFIHGRHCKQPRESVYVADGDLPAVKYSGHEPSACSWEDFPALGQIANSVRMALPDVQFNSVLINRYANGSDYVSWHSDDATLYGPVPTIASITLGAERDFLIRRKKRYAISGDEGVKDRYSFLLKHGSLVVMRGNMQRDWQHSIPKRTKVGGVRLNLTFRAVLNDEKGRCLETHRR